MTRSFLRRWAVAIAAVGVPFGCTVKQEAPKIPLAQATAADSARTMAAAHGLIGPDARAALDSGNRLFRKKDYEGALARYRAASNLAPQHAAPYFGMYMVGRATKDTAMADSALAAIRVRNGPMTPVPHSGNDSAVQRIHETIRKRAATG
jgi:hypothetical protein